MLQSHAGLVSRDTSHHSDAPDQNTKNLSDAPGQNMSLHSDAPRQNTSHHSVTMHPDTTHDNAGMQCAMTSRRRRLTRHPAHARLAVALRLDSELLLKVRVKQQVLEVL